MKGKLIPLKLGERIEFKDKETGSILEGTVSACYKRNVKVKFNDQEKVIHRKYVTGKL